jgi:hypothetical protein
MYPFPRIAAPLFDGRNIAVSVVAELCRLIQKERGFLQSGVAKTQATYDWRE